MTSPVRNDFYHSPAWLELRARRLAKSHYRCECCGGTPGEGYRLEVHHLRPRNAYPQLELAFDNTRVLCRACHQGVHWWPYRGHLPATNDPRYEVQPRRRRQPPPEQLSLDF